MELQLRPDPCLAARSKAAVIRKRYSGGAAKKQDDRNIQTHIDNGVAWQYSLRILKGVGCRACARASKLAGTFKGQMEGMFDIVRSSTAQREEENVLVWTLRRHARAAAPSAEPDWQGS